MNDDLHSNFEIAFFDTHCHLNFQAFEKIKEVVINDARLAGINNILVPGTDIPTSKKAIQLAQDHTNIYAAVGIHPHHIYGYHKDGCNNKYELLENDLVEIEKLLISKKVVAVGEVGIDRYYYHDTKYSTYAIDEEFVELQKLALTRQIEFAVKYDKSLILHNRLAKEDLLEVLDKNWDGKLKNKTVFHCCEPDETLLKFALDHSIFIGIDGDVTFSKKKKQFVKKIPLELLVLETDSPYLTPRPLRENDATKWPNTPSNLPLIAHYIADILQIDIIELKKISTENALRLFGIVS